MSEPGALTRGGGSGESEGLGSIRAQLDAIDAGIVDLIARRLEIVDAVSQAKARTSAPVRDLPREREVLDRVAAAAVERGVPDELVRRIFRQLVGHAVDRQVADLLPGTGGPLVVAFHGTAFTVDHLAAQKFMSARPETTAFEGYPTYAEAVAAVRSGRCHLAVLPVESTTAGSINAVYDLLQSSGVAVVGEETVQVEHCLATVTEAPVAGLRHIASDAHGLEVCAAFLASLPDATPVVCADTSAAMRLVEESGDPSWAAIGPPDAAEAHGLVTVRRHLSGTASTYVRFLVVARAPLTVDLRIPSKTSIVLVTRHEDGALLRCLQILAASGRSMTKLESRPLPGRPFEYLFFLDFEGNVADPRTAEVVEELRRSALSLTVLGSYPAKVTAADADPQRRSTAADGIEAVLA